MTSPFFTFQTGDRCDTCGCFAWHAEEWAECGGVDRRGAGGGEERERRPLVKHDRSCTSKQLHSEYRLAPCFSKDNKLKLVGLKGRLEAVEMSLSIEENEIASLPITVDPNILGGTPVFSGTRVPVDALLNNLEAGVSLDEFLQNFPTVSREQTIEVIEFSRATLHRLKKIK